MISFVYHTVGIKPEIPAATKQTPPAKQAWLLVSLSPPKRVHFIPTVEVQIPTADRTHARTMVARAACTWVGRDRTEYCKEQLNIPVLYHVQSIHSPCSCTMAVMMLEPASTRTFQLGSRVAVSMPEVPDKARTKARSWRPAEAMPLCYTRCPRKSWCLIMRALGQNCSYFCTEESQVTEGWGKKKSGLKERKKKQTDLCVRGS